MAHVRLAPDRVGLLGLQDLERDRVHRRHRGELHEPLRLGVLQSRGGAGKRFEARHEETGGAV